MDVVAGRTCHPFSAVSGKPPTEILLVVSLYEIVSVDVLKVPVIVPGGFKVHSQGLAGLIVYRPFDTLYLGRLATAVTGAADLGSKARGQM